jgi:hypothetical protein
LYDLSKDRGQENDLSKAQPDRVASMTAAIREWQKTLPAPPKVYPAAKTQVNSKSQSPNSKEESNPKVQSKAVPDRATAFVRWDKNKDEVLTLDEYTNGLAHKEKASQRFKSFDKDGNGELTREEFVGAP